MMMMRNLKRSALVFSWLSAVALAQGIESRGLSDTLNSILGPGNEGIAKQIEGQLAAGGGQAAVQPVMTTYIIDGPNGAISTVLPLDGVFVTTLIEGMNPGSGSANNPGKKLPPAMVEPVTTITNPGKLIPTLSAPPPAAVADSTVKVTNTTRIYTTVTPPAAPKFENGVPPPAKQIEPPNSAAAPGAPFTLTGLPSVVFVTQAPPAASPPAAPAPAPPAAAPSVAPAGPGALGLTTGQGKILPDGTCGCSCMCDGSAFPPMPAAAPALAPGLQAPFANTTTLQTIITPPTSSVSLPSTLLIDTKSPPPAPGTQASSSAQTASASGTASSASSGASTTTGTESSGTGSQTTAPGTDSASATPSAAAPPPSPAQGTDPSAASTIRFSLGNGGGTGPTAAPELSQAQPQLQPGGSIDISKFTLVSSLILGNLGA